MTSDTADINLRRESLLAASGNFTKVFLQFATVAILARALGVAGLGEYFFVVTLAVLAAKPTSAFGNVLRKRVSEVEAPRGELLSVWFLASLPYLLVVGGLAWMAGDILTSRTAFVAGAMPAFTAVLFGGAIFSAALRLYDGLGSPGRSMWVSVVRDGVFVAGLGWLLIQGTTPVEAVYWHAGISAIFGVGIFAGVSVLPRIPSRDSWQSMYDFGRWSVPAKLMASTTGRLPVIALGTFSGGAAVGLFEAAFRLTELGPLVAVAINDVLLVKLSGKSSKGESVGKDITSALTYTSLVAVPVFVVAVVLAEPLLVTVYTPEFAAAAGALMLIGVARILYTFWSPLLYALNGCDYPELVFRTQAVRLLISLPVILALTYVFGLMGTVAGFVVAHGVPLVGGVYYGRQVFSNLEVPRGLSHQVVAGVVMGAVLLGLNRLMPPTNLVLLGATLVLGALVYVGVLMARSPDVRGGVVLTVRESAEMVKGRVSRA